MTYDEMIAVIKAKQAGDVVQYRRNDNEEDVWEITSCPIFNFEINDYRVKPISVDIWMNIYSDGSLSHHLTKKEAEEDALNTAIRIAVHVKEVSE